VTGLTLGLIRPKRWIVVLKQHIPEKNVTFGIPPFTKLLCFRIIAFIRAFPSDRAPGTKKMFASCAKKFMDTG
jgi:hypothetical protein